MCICDGHRFLTGKEHLLVIEVLQAISECIRLSALHPQSFFVSVSFSSPVYTCIFSANKANCISMYSMPYFTKRSESIGHISSLITADVDECEINGTCPEHSTCANTFGSFVCTCNEGFMRNGSVCIGKWWPFF